MPEKEYAIPLNFILIIVFVLMILLILFSTRITSGLAGDKTIPTIVLGAIIKILGK